MLCFRSRLVKRRKSFGGLILLLGGIALVGWLRPKGLGIITTVSSALMLIIYILRTMALQ
jgi:hypothetical protein